MNLIFRCLTVLLTLIGNEAVFAFSGIGNTLDFGELAAFPGAEGYGRMTTGGRGGEVYIVTSLADDGMPGTLRYGIESWMVLVLSFFKCPVQYFCIKT